VCTGRKIEIARIKKHRKSREELKLLICILFVFNKFNEKTHGEIRLSG